MRRPHKKRKLNSSKPSNKKRKISYSKYEFEGDFDQDKSPFQIMPTNELKFGNVSVNINMSVPSIIKRLGDGLDLDTLIENHNVYYEPFKNQIVKKNHMDSKLLISLIRQTMCQECRKQSVNCYCTSCGIWTHNYCHGLTEEDITFICSECDS